MAAADDKNWASKYLLDPLTAPEPSQEDGPGTHFIPNQSDTYTSPTTSTPQQSLAKKDSASVTISEAGTTSRNPYPTPPQSASPQQSRFTEQLSSSRNSMSQASTQIPTSTGGAAATDTTGGRHRNNSLPSRHPGDTSNRPLDILRHESKRAHRSPHLRKKHFPGADSIDTLDTVGGGYHHEGPYDATLLSRNTDLHSSPVEAVRGTNNEALKATPRERIQDSLRRHKPLDGTAMVPPGERDMLGNYYEYEEGTDMMIENGGDYKRWPGVKYLPEDLKGKGEPSYSIEKALKEHKRSSKLQNGHTRNVSEGIELMASPRTPQSPPYRDSLREERPRPRSMGSDSRRTTTGQSYSEWEAGLRQRESGQGLGGSVRRRFGSLRRKEGNQQ